MKENDYKQKNQDCTDQATEEKQGGPRISLQDKFGQTSVQTLADRKKRRKNKKQRSTETLMLTLSASIR